MAFYLTTPLYYVNDQPHIGHSYTTVVADVLTRYHRLFGEDAFFLTGTDEHGQKCQNAARARGLEPQAHADDMVKNFERIWRELEIEYDFFIRTTMDFHKKAVQASLQELFDKGEIYSHEYEGWYSVSEEIFFTDKEVVNGKSPAGNDVQRVSEKNYFFKMSKYQDKLIRYIETHPDYIQPDVRRNEVVGFLKQPLNDLCISRPKSRLSWGIEIPFDREYVTYVWFDALLNYAAAVGYQQPERAADFEKWWKKAGAIHLIGKDILTTHAVYWSTMLMALEVPLPKKIFAHGWWLTEENEKMSKSKGAVVRPLDMKDVVGVDGLRYFLTRDINFGNDAQFSEALVISRVNSELANNLGNLLSRTTNLVHKFFEGRVPPHQANAHKELASHASGVGALVKEEILALAPNKAVGHVVELLTQANRFMEVQAPWTQAKTDLAAAGNTLYAALECLRIAGILLHPVMPAKMTALLADLSWNRPPTFADAQWGLLKEGSPIQKSSPLFPRVEKA